MPSAFRRLALLRATLPALVASAAACGPPAQEPHAAPSSAAASPVAPGPRRSGLTLEQAGLVPSWMDTSVDPCSDYFAYACGGFVKAETIPPDRSEWSPSSMVEKEKDEFLHGVLEKAASAPGGDGTLEKLGDYYAACMDQAAVDRLGTSPVRPLFDEVAGVRDIRTLAHALARLHARAIFALFAVGSGQDFKDANQVVLFLDQNGVNLPRHIEQTALGLPDRDYYLKSDGNMKDIRSFYAAHVARMLSLAGVPAKEVPAAAADVLRIETKIARIQQDKVERRDPYQTYHPLDRAALRAAAKTFPWDDYFSALGLAGVSKLVSTPPPAFFSGIDALLRAEPISGWRHYLTWQIVRTEAGRLSKAIVDESFLLEQQLNGEKEITPRWKRCLVDIDDELGDLLAQPYVAARFANDSKARAEALARSIREAMRVDLKSLGWMDDATRAEALAKLDRIAQKVGYPETWRKYDFPISRATYAKNAMVADQAELARFLSKAGKPVNRGEWSTTPPTVNAFYDHSLNEVVLPAGELQPPLFSRDFYEPVNIGATGAATIGHELTHAFDDEGSLFDGAGNLRNWWSAGTKASFDASTTCVKEQYAGYEAVPGVWLDGSLTAGENIADIGGVKLGVVALEDWENSHGPQRGAVDGASDEQVFFLGYAQSWCSILTPQRLESMAHSDPHSPPRWRVDGPLSDAPAFAAAYHCNAGSPMVRANVCAVW